MGGAVPEAAMVAQPSDELELNEYEMQRLANIERNRLRLAAILAEGSRSA